MPSYYFDTTIGATQTEDNVGFTLDAVENAEVRAEAMLNVLIKEHPGSSVAVEVRDTAGSILHSRIAFQN